MDDCRGGKNIYQGTIPALDFRDTIHALTYFGKRIIIEYKEVNVWDGAGN